MFKILNAEPGDYSAEALKILETFGQIDCAPLTRAELKNRIGPYNALIVRLGHKIDNEIFAHAKNLKAIVTATTGLNHIDLTAAHEKNIAILSLQGETEFLDNIRATAEHTIGLMLALLRHIPAATCDVHEGNWNRNKFKGRELYGRTLGLIGYGRLGKIIARYADVFGMTVLACDHKPDRITEPAQAVTMQNLLQTSDIISLHASYMPDNESMMDANAFSHMKNTAFFINTARGELVDEDALLNALQNQRIAGAALDVLKNETNLDKKWLQRNPLWKYAQKNNNLILTPHIGGATCDSMEKTEIFMARKLQKWVTDNLGP